MQLLSNDMCERENIRVRKSGSSPDILQVHHLLLISKAFKSQPEVFNYLIINTEILVLSVFLEYIYIKSGFSAGEFFYFFSSKDREYAIRDHITKK